MDKQEAIDQLKTAITFLTDLVNDFELDRAETHEPNSPFAVQHRIGPVMPVSLITDGRPLSDLPKVSISVHTHEIKKWYVLVLSADCPTDRKRFVTDVKVGVL